MCSVLLLISVAKIHQAYFNTRIVVLTRLERCLSVSAAQAPEVMNIFLQLGGVRTVNHVTCHTYLNYVC